MYLGIPHSTRDVKNLMKLFANKIMPEVFEIAMNRGEFEKLDEGIKAVRTGFKKQISSSDPDLIKFCQLLIPALAVLDMIIEPYRNGKKVTNSDDFLQEFMNIFSLHISSKIVGRSLTSRFDQWTLRQGADVLDFFVGGSRFSKPSNGIVSLPANQSTSKRQRRSAEEVKDAKIADVLKKIEKAEAALAEVRKAYDALMENSSKSSSA